MKKWKVCLTQVIPLTFGEYVVTTCEYVKVCTHIHTPVQNLQLYSSDKLNRTEEDTCNQT